MSNQTSEQKLSLPEEVIRAGLCHLCSLFELLQLIGATVGGCTAMSLARTLYLQDSDLEVRLSIRPRSVMERARWDSSPEFHSKAAGDATLSAATGGLNTRKGNA